MVSAGAHSEWDALSTDMEATDKPQGSLSCQALLIQRKAADLLAAVRGGAAGLQLKTVASVWSNLGVS